MLCTYPGEGESVFRLFLRQSGVAGMPCPYSGEHLPLYRALVRQSAPPLTR
jgi:hypothetical protein